MKASMAVPIQSVSATYWTLREADENLGAPDVPMQRCGILGDCLNVLWGEERLRRFVTIATSSSILDAAERLDSDPSTVVRSLRALEKALGVNLIEHHARSQPVRLSADGTELLRAANGHTIRLQSVKATTELVIASA